MLPQSLLLCSTFPTQPLLIGDRKVGATLVPHYLNERDYPWIARFYSEFLRFRGKRRRELTVFFREKLCFDVPEKKAKLLLHLLHKASEDDQGRGTGKIARALRATLFECSASFHEKPDPSQILLNPDLVGRFKRTPPEILEAAFSDLPMERILTRLPEGLTSQQISLRVNLALAQGFIGRCSEVEIRAEGDIRRVIRQAKLRRLICEMKPTIENRGHPPILRISGPLSLFGHTTVYGHALSELVPLLTWCNRFTLLAICRVRGKDAYLKIQSGDPILPAAEPTHFDSQLEQRFAKEFKAEAPDWDLIREPEAFQIQGPQNSMIFPDFLIRHRRDPKLRFFLEIVGYWTEDYLTKKLRNLQAARTPTLILCVDESLCCGEQSKRSEFEKLGLVVFFRKKILVSEILNRIPQLIQPLRGQSTHILSK